MKIFLLLLFLPVAVFSQDIAYKNYLFTENESGLVEYSDIVDCKGTKDQNYRKAINWFTSVFPNAKDVIQVQDKELGMISGNSTMDAGARYYFDFTITIDVKDDKFRYKIHKIARRSPYARVTGEEYNAQLKDMATQEKKIREGDVVFYKGAQTYIKAITENLKQYMGKAANDSF